jgi:hypothetical protein
MNPEYAVTARPRTQRQAPAYEAPNNLTQEGVLWLAVIEKALSDAEGDDGYEKPDDRKRQMTRARAWLTALHPCPCCGESWRTVAERAGINLDALQARVWSVIVDKEMT